MVVGICSTMDSSFSLFNTYYINNNCKNMDRLYLVILEMYHEEENSITDICTSRETAERLLNQYTNCTKDSNYSYRIDEINLNPNEEVLWDCYKNTIFRDEDN